MEAYLAKRQDMMQKDRATWANTIELSPEEQKANIILKKQIDSLKQQFQGNPGQFHFYDNVDIYAQSQLYKIVKSMPKAVLQHIHLPAAVDIQKQAALLHTEKLWINMENYELKMSTKKPQDLSFTNYLEELNKDSQLKDKIINKLFVTYSEKDLPSIPMWRKFQNIFSIIMPFQFYEEMFFKVFEIALQDLVDDNIQRVEFKHTIGCLYNDNGSISVEDECLKIKECIRSFNEKRQQQNLSTIQVALINAFPKFFSLEVIKTKIEETIKLRSQFPDLILGFDLVAEEETSTQNIAFAEAFVQIPSLEQKYGIDLPLYLHCGETVDQYLETVYDVLALSNVRRIGHGLAFVKHPYLVQNEIIPRNIVVEACPISNQILGYVKDLRAHPALNLLNMGAKVTINPDDPSCFKYQGVTFDYLSVLLAWQLDLGGLKTLVFNTLDFIDVKSNEKEVLVANVKKSWDLWITQILSS